MDNALSLSDLVRVDPGACNDLPNRKRNPGRKRVRVRSPCDGCHKAEHCKTQHVACAAFAKWVKTGYCPLNWPATPSATIYDQVFDPDAED